MPDKYRRYFYFIVLFSALNKREMQLKKYKNNKLMGGVKNEGFTTD